MSLKTKVLSLCLIMATMTVIGGVSYWIAANTTTYNQVVTAAATRPEPQVSSKASGVFKKAANAEDVPADNNPRFEDA